MQMIREKYPDLEIDWIWFDLQDTKDHWEAIEGKRATSERMTVHPLKKVSVRVWKDGSFDFPTNIKYEEDNA